MRRYGFSLIELLIVIMIIGIVYTLAIQNFNRVNEKDFKLKLSNLKEYLISFPYTKSVEVLCLDDCSRCDILVNGEKIKSIDGFLNHDVTLYRYDYLYGYMETEKKVYFNADNVEKDICFSYEIDRNGVGEQILVEYENKFYDFTTYFTDTEAYTSIDSALEAREKVVREVR